MPNIIEINDFYAPELNVYARLTEAQLMRKDKPEEGIFIAESPKVIERALESGYEPVSLLVEKRHLDGEAKDIVAKMGDIPVYTAEFEIISRITGFNLTRGALCAMRRKAYPSLEEVLTGARRVAILEDVMNPTNVGAIFRSAAALNMDAVLLSPGCANPLYRRAIRVSMGNVFLIPWTYFGEEYTGAKYKVCDNPLWPDEGMKLLKEFGFKTAAMALSDDSVSVDDENLLAEDKIAVILGTEGDGLRDTTISGCDYTVKIPMANGVDSLNVAAASAVAFWMLGNR
ncbi:MAG: RNA methyltransferase [Anaerofustis stercorihominis]|nr:RNA methyltransferase [Anaerofustis stercorihominis]